MEVININLKDIDTSLAGKANLSKGTKDFSKVLDMIIGEELDADIDLEVELEKTSEETLAYLIDSSGLNLDILKNYSNVDLSSGEDINIQNLNLKDNSQLETYMENLTRGNIKEMFGKLSGESKEISKDLSILNTETMKDSIGTNDLEDMTNKISKALSAEIANKPSIDKPSIDKQLESKDILNFKSEDKDNLKLNTNKTSNLDNLKEDSFKFRPEETTKDLQKNISKNEDMEIKPFSLEDMENSFRKIETKDIIPKEIKTSKLSEENIEILKDSIVKLIEIRDKGEIKTMNVKLIPKELGSIDISLKMEEGKLVAKILFENDQARQIFSNNMKDLNQSLQRQDISIEEIQIDLNSNSNKGSNGGNRQQQQTFKDGNVKFEEVNLKKEISTRSYEIAGSGVSILV